MMLNLDGLDETLRRQLAGEAFEAAYKYKQYQQHGPNPDCRE
jgi:hypothetical protein